MRRVFGGHLFTSFGNRGKLVQWSMENLANILVFVLGLCMGSGCIWVLMVIIWYLVIWFLFRSFCLVLRMSGGWCCMLWRLVLIS